VLFFKRTDKRIHLSTKHKNMPHNKNVQVRKFCASAKVSLTRSDSDNSFVRRPVPDTSGNHWWSPLRRGLVFEPNARHYRQMRQAVWLYLYCLVNANAREGTLFRRLSTIAKDTGIPVRTIRRWLGTLKRNKYITAEYNGHFWQIAITKWRPISKFPKQNRGWLNRLKSNLFSDNNRS
jgi:hypothetical protein